MDTTHPETALLPYLQGELSEDEKRRLELHLEGCTHCRESIDSSTAIMRAIVRSVENLPEPDWHVYRAQLHRKLAARRQPKQRWWRNEIAWPLITAGVATAALVLGLFFSQMSQRPTPPPVDQLAMEGAINGPDVGLLRNYQVVDHLDLLENYDVIEGLDKLTPAVNSNAPSRS
jgi:anti-sigma factor RsiW